MRPYSLYILLMVIIFIAAISSWGDIRATIMYGIAIAGLAGLVLLQVLNSIRLRKVKGAKI